MQAQLCLLLLLLLAQQSSAAAGWGRPKRASPTTQQGSNLTPVVEELTGYSLDAVREPEDSSDLLMFMSHDAANCKVGGLSRACSGSSVREGVGHDLIDQGCRW